MLNGEVFRIADGAPDHALTLFIFVAILIALTVSYVFSIIACRESLKKLAQIKAAVEENPHNITVELIDAAADGECEREEDG